MALTKFTEDVEVISKLGNLPNDDDDLTPDALKAKFDEAASALKDYINNTLIPETEAAIDAAASGIDTHTTIPGSAITAHSIMTDQLSNVAGVEAVKGENIQNSTISEAKLDSLLSGKINGHTASITNLGTAVGALSDDVLELIGTVDDLGGDLTTLSGTVTSNYNTLNTGKQTKHTTATLTLAKDLTSWDVSVTGLTTTDTVIVSYGESPEHVSSFADWRNCGIHCTGQSTGQLSFAADVAPSNPVYVNIVILP